MTSTLSRLVGILLVVVVTLLVGSHVFAQGPRVATSNPLTQVLAKLDQILTALSPEIPDIETAQLHLLARRESLSCDGNDSCIKIETVAPGRC